VPECLGHGARIRVQADNNNRSICRDFTGATGLEPATSGVTGLFQRRHISVVTSPNERGVLGLCTRLRDSAFKRSLAELPIGAEVEVEEPKGNFLLPEDTSRRYVVVAGGIGITVFRCVLCSSSNGTRSSSG